MTIAAGMQKSPIEAAPIRLKPQRRSADTIRVACLGNSIGSAATTMGNKNASIRGSTACIDGRPLGVSLAIMDAGVPSDNATTTAVETVAAIVRQHETTDRIPPIRYSREFPPSRRCGVCTVPEAKSYPQSHRTAVPGFSSLHADKSPLSESAFLTPGTHTSVHPGAVWNAQLPANAGSRYVLH